MIYVTAFTLPTSAASSSQTELGSGAGGICMDIAAIIP